MNDISRRMDPFAQPFAVDGIPAARPLTRDDLVKIQVALTAFEKALADSAPQTVATEPAPQAKQGADGDKPGSRAGSETPPAQGAFHCLIVTGYLGKGYGSQPDYSTEDAVADACAKHFKNHGGSPSGAYPAVPRPERIHVILDSGGGSLDSAYKTVLYLRSFVEDVRVYVPCRAKSAATLIAIGADLVVMSPFSELGPLDTQITDPRSPTKHVSALDCYRSVDYVREFGVQTVARALTAMLDETQALLPLSQLIDLATTFAVGTARPLLEQVKALDFGAWGRTLKIAETYARELRLRLRHPDSEEAAERLAAKLVYGYPHHPYPIDRTEAERLKIAFDTMTSEVYEAARAIAEACHGGSRFVGFSDDVEAAIAKLPEPTDGARGLAPAGAAAPSADGSPHAMVSEDEPRQATGVSEAGHEQTAMVSEDR